MTVSFKFQNSQQQQAQPGQELHGSGPTLINLTAKQPTTLNSTNSNKEFVFSLEDFSNLLLDTDLVVPQSLSSVESVEVFTLKLLMLVPISSVRPSKILKKMISLTQVPLPITSVITSEILPVWDPIFSVLLLSPLALPSLCPPLLTNSFPTLTLSSSQLLLLPQEWSLHGSLSFLLT